jgi:hypothetical protein
LVLFHRLVAAVIVTVGFYFWVWKGAVRLSPSLRVMVLPL